MRFARLLTIGALVLLETVPARAQAPGVFQQRCAVCHQQTGVGIPGVYPPIADTIGGYVRLPQGRAFLIHLLLHGMDGEITSQGTTYEGLMPPAADFSDEDLADAINYVLQSLNARQLPTGFKPITPQEFKAARAYNLTPTDVLQEREKLLAALGKLSRADSAGR
ncbi:MAG: c-type cytochrome [Candidatus Binataceae bacterium]